MASVRHSLTIIVGRYLTAMAGVHLAAVVLTDHPHAVVLALPAFLVGGSVGFLLLQSIRFWRNAATGALWRRGGVVCLAVWLARLALWQGVA